MKITIEGTDTNKGHFSSVSCPNDDVDLIEIMELIKQVLLGYGFHYESIKRYFEDEQ